ncbi:YdeI/OmpD-associated family protein [Microbacterium rhizosphaerae]|uniref:YdeI/OmpD-associated family protein n=1 Tax=Microbacterium rhizosphaerae TaxID=1678237 RepID=A0ABZ0SLG5_9MICO|nr:YdeI/OmpD-associated family protein [Microbacterium rhizosphaerae]WPR90237.1 YdeI/OmpD-associated family protein [Microbacterium rhizosphaerae]
MAKMDDAPRVHVETVDDWRTWLHAHSASSDGAWLVVWRPATGRSRIDYEDAVLEALCVGWIDGQAKPLDDERSMLWFAPRSPNSAWAGTNKARVAMLVAEGRMRPAGQRLIDLAQANGMWTVLDGPEAGIEPPDLTAALDADPAARMQWDAWTPGVRKAALSAIALAKKPETRRARIARIAADAAAGRKPA